MAVFRLCSHDCGGSRPSEITAGALGLKKHPDKTLIGRTGKGFDFLGYHLGPEGLTVAKATLSTFAKRAVRT